MACGLHLMTVDAPDDAIAGALAGLRGLEQLWSRFVPSSDISRLNRSGGMPTAVAPETLTLVETMREAYRMTGGAYDPTILRALVDLGYGVSRVDPTMQTVLLPPVPPPALRVALLRVTPFASVGEPCAAPAPAVSPTRLMLPPPDTI